VDRGRRALAGILVAASVGCTATPAIETAGASCSTIDTVSASDAAGTAAVAGQPTACEADAKEQDAAGPTGDPSDPPVAAVPAAAVVPVPAAGSAPPSAPLFEESGQAVGDDPAVSKDPGSEGPPRLGADRAAGEELPGGIPRAGDDGRHSSADAASADGAPLGVNDRAGAKTRAKENPPADGSDRAGGGRTASGGPGKGNDRAGGKSRTTNGASAGDGRPWGTPAVIGDGQALGEPTDSDAGAGTAAPRNSASVAIAARSIAHVTGDPIAPAADDPSAPVNADSGSGVPEPSSHIVGIAAATPRNAGAAGAPDARRTSAAPMHGPASGVVTTVQAAAGQIAAQTALRLSPRDVSAALLEPAPRSAVPTAHSSAPRAISPWLGAAPASEALNMAPSAPPRTAAPHGAGRHPTRSGAAGDGRDRRAPASPTAPRGRGSVTGSSGGTAGSAGSAVWCVILIGFLVYSIQPLRRHRVLLVAVGPVVFPALHERPG
jgi:hypothetical protein